MRPYSRSSSVRLAAATAVVLSAAALCACHGPDKPEAAKTAPPTDDAVELTQSQLQAIQIEPVAVHRFSPQRTAVGSIDFDEDKAVQVFSNYQGKIVQAFAQVGDVVRKGQPLYTIESPDLMQAGSTLISAQGAYDAAVKALDRARKLKETNGISDQNLEQAVSAEISAEAALKAARAAMAVFGKSDSQIDQMIAQRRIDPALVVPSPISGRVTARNAQPGLLVQPGAAPAPYAVADTSAMWMLANVAESDTPLFRQGQAVRVKVMAVPDRDFAGTIDVVGASVDPNTHTTLLRSVVRDPQQTLRPGMLATFVIAVGSAASGVALPQDGVVREADGSMNIWVTTDRKRFTRRAVKLGLLQDGFQQITEGLAPGELAVTRGAVFLSNMKNAAESGE
jgi:cobalt-zinc-cadmium efflux system membrane fusion protein